EGIVPGGGIEQRERVEDVPIHAPVEVDHDGGLCFFEAAQDVNPAEGRSAVDGTTQRKDDVGSAGQLAEPFDRIAQTGVFRMELMENRNHRDSPVGCFLEGFDQAGCSKLVYVRADAGKAIE